MSIHQEESRPIENGFAPKVSVPNSRGIRCAERVSDKCHFECDVKNKTQKLTHTTVRCDGGKDSMFGETVQCKVSAVSDFLKLFCGSIKMRISCK